MATAPYFGAEYFHARYFSAGGAPLVAFVVRSSRTLLWDVAPSPNRITWALYGRWRPPSYTFRFERRDLAGQFLEDVTPAFIQNTGEIEANNDRDVFRSFRADVDPGADVELDTLRDNVLVVMDLLVDGSYLRSLPMGLFVLVRPQNAYRPAVTVQAVEGFDVSFLLANQATPTTYTVAAGTNYVTAALAVIAAVSSDLRTSIPPTTKTLPTPMSWAPGTPYLRILSQLLGEGLNYYLPWADVNGVLRTRPREDLAARTPDVAYSGDDFVLAEQLEESQADIWYNHVVTYVDDPQRAPISAVRTNADPSSPISTVNTGRTFSLSIAVDRAADSTVLGEIAEQFLRDQAAQLVHLKLTTSIDPRRDGEEVMRLDVDGVYDGATWWVRNWTTELRTGGRSDWDLSRTASVVAS